ncbi:septal ring lytic transglycosylase RlpA family protein [Indioceanicola profundi]|uniref:septal ring lytic transglycosylase RlpA family protein n=1 Tax=Indioceanicola profundi TaxID=2220096 RepID=UPI000E6A9B01|nr:septal ring lytic transglycosylase RlpA family protein [Indioceanicola profundi]
MSRVDIVGRNVLRGALAAIALAGLAACGTAPPKPTPVADSAPGLPKAGIYKVGNPYQINGVWYYPRVDYDYDETGIASWYGPGFHTKVTANGEIYNENELTAAHKTLPMPSLVRVTNLDNGRSIVVRINDRGPFATGRIIDMSRRGAQLLGFEEKGLAKVRVEVLAEESRAIAAAAQASGSAVQVAGAADGSPPPVAAPRPSVQVEGQALPPPAPTRTIEAPTSVAGRTDEDGRFLPAPVVQQERLPAGPQQIWVQAGAFTIYDNANRLRARLTSLGPSVLSTAMVNDTQFFRVRIGPLTTVEQADSVLAQVIGMGNNSARIIVE